MGTNLISSCSDLKRILGSLALPSSNEMCTMTMTGPRTSREEALLPIPIPMGVLDFPDVTRNSVIGILAIAMESDRTPWQIIDDRVATIRQSITAIARRDVESRNTPVDASNSAFVDMIQEALLESVAPLTPTLMTSEAAENIIFSAVDTDELIGVNAMVFMHNPPTGGLALPHYIPPYFVDALEDNKVYPMGSTNNSIRFENNDLEALYFTSMILQRSK